VAKLKMMRKVTHNGASWCSVGHAALYLRTNAQKVRELMGSGELAYMQKRVNGTIFVSVTDLVKIQTARLAPKPKGSGTV